MIRQDNSDYNTLETISVLALASMLFGFLLKNQILLYAAPVLLIIAIFIKPAARKLAQGWLMFSHVIGFINTRIILFLIFFLWLTPIAFIYRIFHKDILNIQPNKRLTTYWSIREYRFVGEDFKKIW